MTADARAAGRQAITEDRFEDAVRELEAAVAEQPASAAVHYDLGRALFLLWRFEAAEASFRRALKIDPQPHPVPPTGPRRLGRSVARDGGRTA